MLDNVTHSTLKSLWAVTEYRALRRLHHVQGLWQASAEGREEVCGRSTKNKRGAERREVEGKSRAASRLTLEFSSTRVSVNGLLFRLLSTNRLCFAAEAHRRAGRHSSHAEVRCLVRRINAGIYCEYFNK